MNQDTISPRHHIGLMKYVPQWFVAAFAIVYLSGYLIDFYYSAALGISENGGDLLKLKYIQIGLNFIVFLLILTGPSLFAVLRVLELFFDPPQTAHEVKSRLVRFFVSLFTACYFLSVYSAFLFTPWHYFQQDPRRIYFILLLIFLVQFLYIGGITFIEKAEKKSIEGSALSNGTSTVENWTIKNARLAIDKFSVYRILLCCSLLLMTFYFDYRAFNGLRATIYECVISGRGFIFIIFCVLFGILLYRSLSRIQKPPIPFAQYVTIMGTGLLVIFYLGLVSYAYSIYPYIPSVKGGADFTNASLVSVTFKRRDAAPLEMLSDVIEVYSTALSAYFAIPSAGNDACSWRRNQTSPKLVQIQQSEIQKIEISPQNPNVHNNC